MPRTLQRGQLRRRRKPPAESRPWLVVTPFKGIVILLVAVIGLTHFVEVRIQREDSGNGKPASEDGSAVKVSSATILPDPQNPPQEEEPMLPQPEEQPPEPEPEPVAEYSLPVKKPLLSDAITDPWKRVLYGRLDKIREECGSLCAVNDMETYKEVQTPPQAGVQYSSFQMPVDCQKLFELEEHDAQDLTLPFPLPTELEPFFSMSGATPVENWKRYSANMALPTVDSSKLKNVKFSGRASTLTWTLEEIDRGVTLLLHGELKGSLGKDETNRVYNKIKEQGGLQDKTVLIIGSETSWFVTVALAAGAAHIVVVEYLNIVSFHHKIRTMSPAKFRAAYLDGTLPKFDAVLSYSSLDHTGLGRYGDSLNPWGDIITLARSWCATRDDGMLMLALPTGPDQLRYNAHRIYGNIRWPLLTTNWQPIDDVTDFTQKQAGGQEDAIHFFRKVPAV